MENIQRWQGPFIVSSIFSLFLVDILPFSLLIFGFALAFGLLLKKQAFCFFIVAGLCWFFLHANWATRWTLPQAQIKQPLTIIGVVSSIPSQSDDIGKFNLQPNVIDGKELGWFNRFEFKLSYKEPDVKLQLGDTIELTAKLKPPHGFANQGGFSYQKWLLLKGIRATGYVVSKQPVTVLTPSTNMRQRIFNKIKQATANLPYQGLILALTVGEKQAITKEQWRTIKATGISHLLAISGLHIGIVFLFGSMLAKLLIKLYCFAFNQQTNVPFITLFFGLAAALGYAWLAGFSIPTVRAFLMLSLLVLMLSVKRTLNARSVIINTLFIILLIDPLSVLEPGLWLSFIAVVVIITTFWWFPTLVKNKLQNYSYSIVKMQLALFVFMVPITIFIFNGFSASGIVVNLVAVPWVSFVTVPLSLIASVLGMFGLPSAPLFSLADSSLAALFILLELPWIHSGWIAAQHLPWYSWVLATVFCLTLLLPLQKTHRLASLLLISPTLLAGLNINEQVQWKVHVLDVGQGLAVVVEKNHRVLLYDLGPVYKSGFNTVDHVVLPFLTHHGYQSADYLVISHADSDHAGAYKTLLRQLKVNTILAPNKILPSAKRCKAQTINWQGLKLELLWPTQGNAVPLSSNDSSCVVKISDGKQSVLLTGDISKRVEKQLLAINPAVLPSTLLIAPHHGSNSSSTGEFIRAVNPGYVVFSAGYLNRYKFPRDEVSQRYQSAGVKQLNTAKSGQISFVFSNNILEVHQARPDILSHWYYNH